MPTMISVRALALCFLIYCTTAAALGVSRTQQKERIQNVTKVNKEESLFDVTERASRHGYSAGEHTVETKDGYLLTLFRLQHPQGGVRGPPVLLIPGLLQSAATWLDAGLDAGLAYLLANASYDVWLGNDRGSYYSRRHAWLNPDTDWQYWQYSVDEIGLYDLPATVDYILTQTGSRKLSYIGFSQSAGSFFIMCSERPEYCDKVNVLIALAPATRLLHTRSILFRMFAEYNVNKEDELSSYNIWEVLPKGGLLQSLLQAFCVLSDGAANFCEIFKDFLDAPNPGSIAKSAYRAATASFPAGTSVHNMARYGQSIRSKFFQKFDYGPEQNLVRYGSEAPPVYNLSAVTVPTVMIYGRNDFLIDPKDVRWLIKKLPNVLEAFVVKDPYWSHLDFCLSRNVPKLVFPKIKEYLDKCN